ncbi:unnamed protein product, partial [Lampetra planeri]
EFGITILKPSHQSVWSRWVQAKQIPDITPPNLQNRSWNSFPAVEEKTPGPPFGSTLGRGLTLTENPGGSSGERHPVRTCPKVLEIRELQHHRPLSALLKNSMDVRLKNYIKQLMEREQQAEEVIIEEGQGEGDGRQQAARSAPGRRAKEESGQSHAFTWFVRLSVQQSPQSSMSRYLSQKQYREVQRTTSDLR